MRVISGLYKGRILDGFDIDGTRPTQDRVKESLFGSIQDYIEDSVVLDLFAGSGNLGIEALSNGAKECYFVDNNKIAINTINNNLNNYYGIYGFSRFYTNNFRSYFFRLRSPFCYLRSHIIRLFSPKGYNLLLPFPALPFIEGSAFQNFIAFSPAS